MTESLRMRSAGAPRCCPVCGAVARSKRELVFKKTMGLGHAIFILNYLTYKVAIVRTVMSYLYNMIVWFVVRNALL
jgi:hypothetical protein